MHQHLLKPLLTRSEVAERLGCSVATVARLLASGQLESVRIGERLVRIPAESVEAYLGKVVSHE